MFTSSWCSFRFVTSDLVKQPFVLFSNEQYLHRAFFGTRESQLFHVPEAQRSTETDAPCRHVDWSLIHFILSVLSALL